MELGGERELVRHHWVGDLHRHRHLHRHRDLHMLLAHLLDHFRALLLVAVPLHDLVVLLALLLKGLNALLLWHIDSGRQALSCHPR